MSNNTKMIDEDETYIYEVLQEKDCAECATLLAHSFTKHNPLEIYMKTSYEDYYAGSLSLCRAILETNLSVIARHKQTTEVHGIVQGVDVKTFRMENDATESDEKSIDPSLELMLESEQKFLKDYEKKYGELKQNDIAHILMVAVRSDCIGQGLGTKINQIFLNHVRRQHFKHVIVDTSSPTIHHIYTKKLNGKVFISIPASTWISKNTRGDTYQPFEHFDGELALVVLEL